ncbi:hypothetical protein E2C01_048860 [Portunus trituberculatus]|uniref:Uncharacterized protein n=1 Tax=Portunus trituberculatus TaxID=210409 RepID=A0A5B7G4T3_PORTR|nr:hypothetical protein [Portunus trituberculatus]
MVRGALLMQHPTVPCRAAPPRAAPLPYSRSGKWHRPEVGSLSSGWGQRSASRAAPRWELHREPHCW